jgi:hypothetical protein
MVRWTSSSFATLVQDWALAPGSARVSAPRDKDLSKRGLSAKLGASKTSIFEFVRSNYTVSPQNRRGYSSLLRIIVENAQLPSDQPSESAFDYDVRLRTKPIYLEYCSGCLASLGTT